MVLVFHFDTYFTTNKKKEISPEHYNSGSPSTALKERSVDTFKNRSRNLSISSNETHWCARATPLQSLKSVSIPSQVMNCEDSTKDVAEGTKWIYSCSSSYTGSLMTSKD